LDDRFERVARRLPEFAGAFWSPTGALVVRLTDKTRLPQARIALLEEFENHSKIRSRPTEAIGADFNFGELVKARNVMRGLPPSPEVIFYDIDERANRFVVGVKTARDTAALRATLETAGVPKGILDFSVVGPLEQTADLDDRVRPVRGGLYLEVLNSMTATTVFVEKCAVGVPVTRGGVAGFFTAAHCSPTYGAVDGIATAWQFGWGFSTHLIGQENADPAPFPCSSPFGRCRSSDVSFYRFSSGVDYRIGMVAKTTTGTNIDPTLANQNQMTGTYLNIAAIPNVGDSVTKTGWWQGTVSGPISRSCIDLPHSGKPAGNSLTILCQDEVDMAQMGGESGSPVYSKYAYNPPGNNWIFAGIAWGGLLCQPSGPNGEPVCAVTIMSEALGILGDLGSWSF
jgi:hypothetical protein